MSELVSVIVPVYDTAQYLPRCIDSVMAQTYTNWQLMLVDDGSTDSSADICRSYAERDSRIRLLSKANGGAADARNFALDRLSTDGCRGFVVFVDSDDSLAPSYLQQLVLKAHEAPDVDLVVCGMANYRDSVLSHELVPPFIDCFLPLANADFLALLRTGLLNSPCNKLYRASIIMDNDLRFSTEVYNEDISFNIDYFSYCRRAVAVPEALYDYHHRAGSITSLVPERAFTDYIALHVKLLALVHGPDAYELVHDFVSYQYSAIALRFMRRKDFAVPGYYLTYPMVQQALLCHQARAYSRVDWVQTFLLRHGLLRLYHFLFL